jgi:hypothetical protein
VVIGGMKKEGEKTLTVYCCDIKALWGVRVSHFLFVIFDCVFTAVERRAWMIIRCLLALSLTFMCWANIYLSTCFGFCLKN